MKNISLIIILLISVSFAAAQKRDKVQDFNRAADLAVEINSKYPLKFSPATDVFTVGDKENLYKIAKAFNRFPNGTVIEIGAHVFAGSDSQSNLDLSARRAAAVKTALVNLGINPKALRTYAYGDKKPLYAMDDPRERQKNDRIGFLITLQSQTEDFKVVLNSSGSDSFDGLIGEYSEEIKDGLKNDPDLLRNADPNPAQTRIASPPSEKIIFDKGWGKAVVGARSKEVVDGLGKPEKEYFDEYLDKKTLYYPQQGLMIDIGTFYDTVADITFIGDATVNPVPKTRMDLQFRFSSFTVPPNKISWRASKGSVVAAYGKPDAEQKGSEYPAAGGFIEVDLLRYGSTWLYFKGNKLYKIVISGK